MKISYRTFTECGPRWKNEDTIGVVHFNDHHHLFVLCDGMGGHRSGDIASQTVADAICRFWINNPKRVNSNKKIIDASNEAMIALDKKSFCGMGTTMAMVCIDLKQVITAHCGDTRIYFATPHHPYPMAMHLRDHVKKAPVGWPYVAKGFIQREYKHVPEIHALTRIKQPGDLFLICSGGVYEIFKKGEIEQLMLNVVDLDELTGILKERCDKSARDNYSAIIIEIL